MKRHTKSKAAIFESLSAKPVSIDQIRQSLIQRKFNINLSTIYRNLESLLNEGKIRKVELGADRSFYELVGEHHHHIVCIGCGSIEDIQLNEEELIANIKKQTKFNISDHLFEFFGLCKSCNTN